MKYDFDEIIDRTGTGSIKLEAGEKINPYLPKEHIPLWVADMDFACAPEIVAAMQQRRPRRIRIHKPHRRMQAERFLPLDGAKAWLEP
ncbi:MAG: hypothetical protein R2881_03045 [Eubacteriales bacterium]